MLDARQMRRVADETCTDDEFYAAKTWLYQKVLESAERGYTVFFFGIDMADPTPNFKLCLTRLKREFEEADYKFRLYWNDNGRPCRIEIAW